LRRCWLALGALGREQARRRGGSRELGCARPAAADRAAVPSRGDPRVSSGAPSPATNPLAPAAAGIAAVFLRFEADPRAWFSAKAQPLSSSGAARRPRVNLAGFLSTTGRCNSLLDSPAASFCRCLPCNSEASSIHLASISTSCACFFKSHRTVRCVLGLAAFACGTKRLYEVFLVPGFSFGCSKSSFSLKLEAQIVVPSASEVRRFLRLLKFLI